MFHPVTTPGHHYLIETNPALTNLGNFYGSDYFLSRIGLDQKKQQVVLLGDAYYETRLVQQQILQSTGQRFLNGYSSDADQMRGLMDAAVNQGTALNLAAGVELTSAQVAALTQDIVWLVEQEVDGQKVYVPRVYLAANSPNSILTGGSMVAANTVNITADSVTNSGSTIRGANSLTMLAGNITNEEGGTLSGKTVQLAAVQDIRNQGAYIAGDTLSLTAGRDIISAAKVELAEGSDAKASQSRVARASGISATNTLQATAGRDVTLTGSALLTGGDASITAGHDITVGSAVTFMERHAKRLDESSTTNHGSAVAVGGNLAMTAGNDLTVAGSTVVAQNNAVLAAARNLSVTATQDTYSFHMRSSKSGGLGKSSSISIDKQSTTANAANVSAGGNLTLAAGNKADISSRADVLVKGSQLQAGKTADITATGSVVFQAAQNSVFTSVSKSSSSLFSSSAKKQASGNVTQVASSLFADNISVQAGDNIRLTASNFFAGKDIALSTTRGDVSLDAAQNSSFSMSQSKSSSVGLFGTTDGFNFFEAKSKMAEGGNRTNVGSALVAGKDISIVSGQDVNARGSLVSAGNNVSINAARDVNMLPGSSSSYAKESSSKSSAGISYSFTSEGYSERVGFNNVMTGSRQAATTNMGNLVTAGNDVSIVSTRDINQVASHVEAKRDVTIAAGRDWNMLAAADTQEFSAWRKEWQAGVTLALKQNVSQAVNAVSNIPAAAGNAQGGGMFTGISAASAGLQAVSSVYNAIFQVVSASVTLGASASEQKASSSSSTAAPSTALAGHDLTASAGQDITIQGGRVQAGNNLTLNAKRDLNVVAATNSYNFSQTASSISGGITGSIGFGASGLAASGSVSASASGSNNRGDGISYTNALVTAGNNLNTTSGRDTNVKGAHAQGTAVDMNVGRDLNVQSLQDKAQNSGSSWALGGSIGFDITGMLPGKIAGMTVHDASGPSASIGGSTSSGSMAWVNGQTSITGKEKVNIYTEKNTDLKGAVLAADNGNLLLNTGTLTHSDIQDKNKQQNISANISSGGQLGNSSLSGSYSKTDQEQINRATVGQGTIIIRSDSSKGAEGLNRDLAKAQEITKNDKVNVTVYLDSQSIKEVASGFSGTLEGIKKLGENLQQMVREIRAITALLPDSLKQLGENRLDLIKNMIRGGSSEDAILTLLKDENYLKLLESDRYASITAMKAGEYGVTFGAERDLSKLVEYGIDTLSKAYEYLNGLENKELIEAAIIGFQVASGGPLAVFKSMLASVATGYLTREIAENIVLGNMYGGRSIDETYDFLYETHNGSTLSKELEKLNNRLGGVQLGFDIAVGIGINAIAGGIKVVKTENLSTIPGLTEGRLLGANGVRTKGSLTVASNETWRIDVENFRPGVEPGNVHLQFKDFSDKYYYNPKAEAFYVKVNGTFTPVSKSQNSALLGMSGLAEGIKKALYYLGE